MLGWLGHAHVGPFLVAGPLSVVMLQLRPDMQGQAADAKFLRGQERMLGTSVDSMFSANSPETLIVHCLPPTLAAPSLPWSICEALGFHRKGKGVRWSQLTTWFCTSCVICSLQACSLTCEVHINSHRALCVQELLA